MSEGLWLLVAEHGISRSTPVIFGRRPSPCGGVSSADLLHRPVLEHDTHLGEPQRRQLPPRRLTACKRLGWKVVPVRLLDLQRVIDGEFAENVVRKDFTFWNLITVVEELHS